MPFSFEIFTFLESSSLESRSKIYGLHGMLTSEFLSGFIHLRYFGVIKFFLWSLKVQILDVISSELFIEHP